MLIVMPWAGMNDVSLSEAAAVSFAYGLAAGTSAEEIGYTIKTSVAETEVGAQPAYDFISASKNTRIVFQEVDGPPMREPDLVSAGGNPDYPALSRSGKPTVSLYWNKPGVGFWRQTNHGGMQGVTNWSLMGNDGNWIFSPDTFTIIDNTPDMPTGFCFYCDITPLK